MTKLSELPEAHSLSGDEIIELIQDGRNKRINIKTVTAKMNAGKSAYELAVIAGYEGTLVDWLNSIRGELGKSAYEIALENGFTGTEAQWLVSLKGETGELPVFVAQYEHTQVVSSDTWIINHNLNRVPGVTVIDSGGNEVEGDYTHPDLNNTVLTFSAAFGGKAYLR